MTRRIVEGNFSARRLGASRWVLSAGPGGPEVLFNGVDAAGSPLPSGSIGVIEVVWEKTGIRAVLTGAEGDLHLAARSAILHEPRPRLYDALPLAAVDDAARRFWKRVFLLMRLPGGRLLLGILARSASSRRRRA